MKSTVFIVFTLLIWLGHPSLAQDRAPENESIRQADLKADLFFLASDAMGGRLTNTPQIRVAAEFIKSRFERMGLEPGGPDGSFYQTFNLATATLADENRLVIASPGQNRQMHLEPGQDYYPLRFSASGSAHGSLAFAGFGIVSAARSHDDYRGESLAGKIVMILDHEPGERDPESPFDGLVTSEASRDIRKALYAQERGAAAILFVTDLHNHPGPGNFEAAAMNYWPSEARRIERYTLAAWMERVRIPAAQISPALANTLMAGTGRTVHARTAERQGGAGVTSFPGVEIELVTAVDRHIVQSRNVVAHIEGSDPEVADEWIIICAHYDHNGADVIEIAEAYARAAERGIRPRRSVLFAAWEAEERGLLGAWAYTEDPLHPLQQTVAVLNMDMIGRNEEVRVGGGRRFRGLELQTAESNDNSVNIMGYTYSPDLAAEIERANQAFGLELKMGYDNNPSNLLRRSDQWPFLQNGVPAVFVHTGLHPDYHTEFDRPEKINYVKMEKIARLVHQVSWNLAQGSVRPRITH
jgi:hypothetical protein